MAFPRYIDRVNALSYTRVASTGDITQMKSDGEYQQGRQLTSRLIHIIESFGSRRVLVVGDLMMDRYVYGDAHRISPEAPVPVLRKRYEEERLGGSGSVAANLRALSIDVTCCGMVGKDAAGQRLRLILEQLGIDMQGVLSTANRPTTTKTRFVGLAQHRHRQQLMRVDDESTLSIDHVNEERLTQLITEIASRVSAVCLEDYGKGLLSTSLCHHAIECANRAGIPVFVDPARLSDYTRYEGATLLTPNRSEFQMIAKCQDTCVETIKRHAGALLEQYNLKSMLVTLDREGSLLLRRGHPPLHVPTRPRAVYDNTGAGDAVLAMLAAAVVSNATWQEAAWLANIAGGLEVERFGCIPVTREEVIAQLKLESGTTKGKIWPVNILAQELAICKRRDARIVFTNGRYDFLQAGDVRFLERCRESGDILVVAVHSNTSQSQKHPGGSRLSALQEQRAEVLAALHSVDYVVIVDESSLEQTIEQLSPDVVISDPCFTGRSFIEHGSDSVALTTPYDLSSVEFQG